MTEADFIPPIEDLIEVEPVPAVATDPRSEAHLALVNQYRGQFAQGARAVSAVSGHLAILAETGDPHSIFDQQVGVLDTLVRSLGNTLTQLQALADSKGTA